MDPKISKYGRAAYYLYESVSWVGNPITPAVVLLVESLVRAQPGEKPTKAKYLKFWLGQVNKNWQLFRRYSQKELTEQQHKTVRALINELRSAKALPPFVGNDELKTYGKNREEAFRRCTYDELRKIKEDFERLMHVANQKLETLGLMLLPIPKDDGTTPDSKNIVEFMSNDEEYFSKIAWPCFEYVKEYEMLRRSEVVIERAQFAMGTYQVPSSGGEGVAIVDQDTLIDRFAKACNRRGLQKGKTIPRLIMFEIASEIGIRGTPEDQKEFKTDKSGSAAYHEAYELASRTGFKRKRMIM